ncbi:hypothetical protein HKBW3S47_02130, partial [Candidatus Hakubella thermalkaliphila]
ACGWLRGWRCGTTDLKEFSRKTEEGEVALRGERDGQKAVD